MFSPLEVLQKFSCHDLSKWWVTWMQSILCLMNRCAQMFRKYSICVQLCTQYISNNSTVAWYKLCTNLNILQSSLHSVYIFIYEYIYFFEALTQCGHFIEQNTEGPSENVKWRYVILNQSQQFNCKTISWQTVFVWLKKFPSYLIFSDIFLSNFFRWRRSVNDRNTLSVKAILTERFYYAAYWVILCSTKL